jgi:hypothetical protein
MGDMTTWDEIRCQRGHDVHATTEVTVELGGPTPYADYAEIPELHDDGFTMEIWSPPYDHGDLYCPGADAVSETIEALGVWDVPTTILLRDAFDRIASAEYSASGRQTTFIDVGAQLGWFSIIAARRFLDVIAIEADPDVAGVLERNINRQLGYNAQRVTVLNDRVGKGYELPAIDGPIIAKVDIEGGEPDAVAALWPYLKNGQVEVLVIEVSPCFHDGYPKLVNQILGLGYRGFVEPPKAVPPHPLAGLDDLEPWELPTKGAPVSKLIKSWHQENVVFVRDRS